MRKKICLVLLILMPFSVVADEHIALSLKNKGIKKLLVSILTHYRKGNDKSIVILPANNFKGSVSKKNLNNNPLVKKLKEFIQLDLNTDLNFHVKWSPITVQAKLVEEKVKVNTFGVGRSFNAVFRLDVSELLIKGDFIEFCEFQNEKNECNKKDGLYGSFFDFELSLKPGEIIESLIETNVKIAKDKVEMKFSKLVSNINSEKTSNDRRLLSKFEISEISPKFNLNFKGFSMPPPVLNIAGTEILLDPQDIQNALLSEREFLANVLTDFAGKFIAKDLVGLVNNKIMSKLDNIKTKYKLIDFDSQRDRREHFLELMEKNPNEAMLFLQGSGAIETNESSFLKVLNRIFRKSIYKANNELVFSHIKAHGDEDIAAFFKTSLFINNKKIKINNRLWNGTKELKKIDFKDISSDYSFAFGISEPLINTILNSGPQSSLINGLFHEFTKMNGVYIDGLNFHMMSNKDTCALDSVKVVANMRVRMSRLERETWSDYIKMAIGEYIESDGIILTEEKDLVFPIEIDFNAVIDEEGDKTFISMVADSPFVRNGLRNTFNYPYENMSKVVESSLIEKLQESLSDHLNTVHRVEITDYINAVPGMKLKPKGLFSSDSGHLVMTFDIEDIDLNAFGGIDD